MDPNRTFSKDEISKILAKASKIQNRKDVNKDEQVLKAEDLQHIAAEVGIDQDSLLEAIQDTDSPERASTFSWFRSSSIIQESQTVAGEITNESWGEIVQEIRLITGDKGKISEVGKSFEWEQWFNDIGYKSI